MQRPAGASDAASKADMPQADSLDDCSQPETAIEAASGREILLWQAARTKS